MSQEHEKSVHRVLQACESEWKRHLLNAGCSGHFVCFSLTNTEGADLRMGLFSLFSLVFGLGFFLSFLSLWYFFLWTFVICKACPCLIFEKFTFCFPLATMLPLDPNCPIGLSAWRAGERSWDMCPTKMWWYFKAVI